MMNAFEWPSFRFVVDETWSSLINQMDPRRTTTCESVTFLKKKEGSRSNDNVWWGNSVLIKIRDSHYPMIKRDFWDYSVPLNQKWQWQRRERDANGLWTNSFEPVSLFPTSLTCTHMHTNTQGHTQTHTQGSGDAQHGGILMTVYDKWRP